MSGPRLPPFEALLFETMRSAGLRGSAVRIALDGDTLVITGSEGGEMRLAPSEVDRMRICVHSSRLRPRPNYSTRIWRKGARAPLAIAPSRERLGTYGPVMREYAGWVLADGGRIIRGYGLFGLIVPSLIGAGGASLFTLALLGEALASGRIIVWIVASFALALTILLSWALVLGQWPRRVTSLDQLDEFLPVKEEVR